MEEEQEQQMEEEDQQLEQEVEEKEMEDQHDTEGVLIYFLNQCAGGGNHHSMNST